MRDLFPEDWRPNLRRKFLGLDSWVDFSLFRSARGARESYERFSTFMDLPLPGLIRAKGYVWLASRPQWVVSYSRAGNTATHEPVGRWWASAPRDRWPPRGSPQRQAIKAREAAGQRLETTLVGIDAAEIVEAELSDRVAVVTV